MLNADQTTAIEELGYHTAALLDLYEVHGAPGEDDPGYHLAEAYKSILAAIVEPELVTDTDDDAPPNGLSS
jgi:hypothetical protein